MRRASTSAVVLLLGTAVAMTWTYMTRNQIFPDTQYYMGWTLRLLGYDEPTSSRLVHDYIASRGSFRPYDDIWSWRTGTLLARSRLLLPFLSVPFVAVFGLGGIVIVPGAVFLAAVYGTYRFARLHASDAAAVVGTLAIAGSPTVVAWNVGGLTDSLALALHVAMLLLLPWRRAVTWRSLAALAAVCGLSGAARPITPFTVATMAALWLWSRFHAPPERRRSWSLAAAAVAAGSLAGAVWITKAGGLSPRTNLFLLARAESWSDLPLWYWWNLPPRLERELRAVFHDGTLLGPAIILSVLACVTAWRTVVPWLIVPAWLGSLGVLLLNPSVPSFRYEIPAVPAIAAALAVLTDQALRRAPRLALRGRRGKPAITACL